MSFGLRSFIPNTLLVFSLEHAINLVCFRYKEFTQGIQLESWDGVHNYGYCRNAGRKSLLLAAVSRAFIPLIYLGIKTIFEAMNCPVTMISELVCFSLALSLSIGIF